MVSDSSLCKVQQADHQGNRNIFTLWTIICSDANILLLCKQKACRDFLELAESHSRRWQRVLQHEREQRTHLEETIEQLAKQHNSLERAWREAPTHTSNTPDTTSTHTGVSERSRKGEASDEDEDTEYFDAMEDSPAFITVTATDVSQHRSESRPHQ
ncbi:oxysterol-binding protein 2 isoform X1, partial [Tachysurus ichikawai]